MSKPKLAVIGASHFQRPLIEKAQEMGCEVHAFAWKCGDVGETLADVFHPISIVEVDRIVEECKLIGIDGVCSIASDLATVAINRVADELGLVGNPLSCTLLSTDKSRMRRAFSEAGDPSPKSVLVRAEKAPDDDGVPEAEIGAEAVYVSEGGLESFDPIDHGLSYPLIVKPIDRSGSRGVTKLEGPDDPVTVAQALKLAIEQGFSKSAIVEEFVEGEEFSVEGISWEGEHRILAITRKATSGAPHFIESAHLEPSFLAPQAVANVKSTVVHALDTLGVRYGASHSEVKVADDGSVGIIEIGARMGGDCIGSDLVPLHTGVDFVRAVVDVALGRKPDLEPHGQKLAAAIRFIFDDYDYEVLARAQRENPGIIRLIEVDDDFAAGASLQAVSDSSTRHGHFIMASEDVGDIVPYLPYDMVQAAGL